MSCFSLIIFNNSDWYLVKKITMHFLKFLFVLGLPIQFYHLPKLSVFQPSGWLWFLSILCHLVLALQGSALFLENFCIKSPGSLYGTLCGSLNITKLKLVYHFSIISQTALFCSSEFSMCHMVEFFAYLPFKIVTRAVCATLLQCVVKYYIKISYLSK